MEIQQSPLYAAYIKKLGWTVVQQEGVYIYIHHLPFTGGLAKIQRTEFLPNIDQLIQLLRLHKVRTVAIEPSASVLQSEFTQYIAKLNKYFRINTSEFLATKTNIVDIQPSENEIFKNFTEAKQRGIRRAVKNNITVEESTAINDLIHIKNKSAGLFGFITTYGAKHLWETLTSKHATILIATQENKKIIGGVLIIYCDDTAYYWIAGATHQGKKLFAPTLLAWEAMRSAKKHGAKKFDFVGVWDERLPHKHLDWKGFTKFKEGFGGTPIYYPTHPQ